MFLAAMWPKKKDDDGQIENLQRQKDKLEAAHQATLNAYMSLFSELQKLKH